MFFQQSVEMIKLYITGRTFRIKKEEVYSTTRETKIGIQQGSLLGPILYLIHTRDTLTVNGTHH